MIETNLRPQSALGKWAAGLIIAFFCFLAIFILLVAIGQRGDDSFFEFTPLLLPGLLAALSGIAAFITGLIAIIKSKERSVLVFLATAVGFAITTFVAGEILVPH